MTKTLNNADILIQCIILVLLFDWLYNLITIYYIYLNDFSKLFSYNIELKFI